MYTVNRNLVFFSILILMNLVACKTEEAKDKKSTAPKAFSKEELKMSVKYMEDSITALYSNPKTANSIPSLTQIELINRLKLYYKNFPNDDYSAECLFKIHIKYSDLKAQKDAMAYGDTLLSKFPKYKNRDFLLESMASSYDVEIVPRDTAKVRKYYSLLLKDSNLSPEKRQDIGLRLKHLELDFFEFIDFQSKQTTKRKK
jgi:hypothetical protein